MKNILVVSFALISSVAFAIKNPTVPSELRLGGMRLKVTEAARREMQKDVDALRASPKYFQIKVDRMNLYFPIIERIFREERLPEEFKYLAIQESALISDAVSSANAVGFWQFKEPAGKEVGLRIDRNVDERLNIVAASRGAAKYLKRMNFYFNNWVYACLAYNQGPGGAKKHVNQKNFGVKKMTIDKNTFWYVKKFFAHYIAFRDEVGKPHSQGLSLIEYEDGANKSLRQVAKELKADEDLVYQYNKWLKRGDIPGEKIYPVVVPFKGKKGVVIASKNRPREKNSDQPKAEIYPDIKPEELSTRNLFVKLNNIKAIVASSDDNIDELAKKGGIQPHHLMKFNDLAPTDKIISGDIYYLRNKKNKSSNYFHTVQNGESLWDISQKFGVKLKKLKSYNRLEEGEKLKTGRVLWLAKKRPKKVPIEYKGDNRLANEVEEAVAEIQPIEVEPEPIENSKDEVIETSPDLPQEEFSKQFKLEEIPDEFVANETEAERISNDPVSEATVEQKNNPEVSYHLVRKGETLYRISKMYDVSVEDIRSWNALPSNDLKPGMNLQIVGSKIEKVPNPAVAESPKVLFHEVAVGETLYAIARKYQISVKELMEVNQIKDGDVLAVGQKLQLVNGTDPLYKERTDNPRYHEVKKGDTMYGVARKYSLSLKELMEMNKKEDTGLSIGEKLKVGQ